MYFLHVWYLRERNHAHQQIDRFEASDFIHQLNAIQGPLRAVNPLLARRGLQNVIHFSTEAKKL